ncbi:hypothetical protein Tco_0492546, partial [Tanacetum coccineum]
MSFGGGGQFVSNWFYFEAMESLERNDEIDVVGSGSGYSGSGYSGLNPGPGRGIRFKPNDASMGSLSNNSNVRVSSYVTQVEDNDNDEDHDEEFEDGYYETPVNKNLGKTQSYAPRSFAGYGESEKRGVKRSNDDDDDDDNDGDDDPLGKLVSSIKVLADGFVKMEKMKMDMVREIETMRMEAEMKRNEMFLESQRQMVAAFVKGLAENKKLDRKIKKSRWIEIMSYAKKLKKLTDEDDILLDSLTWCNGKVLAYAMGVGMDFIIQIIIVVKEKEVVISLLPLSEYPFPYCNGALKFLGHKGSNMTSTTSKWEEIDDLKDAIFFVNFYDWLEGDYEEANCTDHKEKVDNDDEIVIKQITNNVVESSNMMNESHLLDILFHLLEMIMKFCVGVEYLNFRATCKRCHLAAPLIQWRSETTLNKLQTYSLASPWLMVLEDNRGIMHFTDPLFGDKYFVKTLPVSINSNTTQICCSSYGWLLFYNNLGYLVFFNPFTSDVRELPTAHHLLENLSFSAPPMSPKCIVLGFTAPDEGHVYILKFGDSDPSWNKIDLDFDGDDPYAFYFPTFFGQDVYALCDEGKLIVFKEIMSEENFSWEDVADAPV